MYLNLFRNRWFALGWVVLTLAGVYFFFGKGGGHESIEKAARQIEDVKNFDGELAEGHGQDSDLGSDDSSAAFDEDEEVSATERNDRSITLGRPGLVDAAQEGEGEDDADTFVVLDAGTVIEEE